STRPASTRSFYSGSSAASSSSTFSFDGKPRLASGAVPAYAPSGQDRSDDFAVDVGESPLDSVVVERQSLVVDSEQVQDSGVEVGPSDGFFGRFPADLVGGAISDSGFESGAGEPDGEAVLVMVAAPADDIGG